MLKRNLESQLTHWKDSVGRKPLVMLGARQVGKTYALKQFASRCFDSIAYVDFSKNPDAADLFEHSISPSEVVANLELYLNVGIEPAKTLIVFDEIQLCERALTSLKYFCEDAPQYHVAAAGSLLGVKVNRDKYSFPVGKVDMLEVNPLTFEEFLWACGEERLADAIRNAFEKATDSFALHERALRLVRDYQIVGGMPEVVDVFASTQDGGLSTFESVRRKQDEINLAYASDMVKYAESSEAPKILEAWNSIPRQLAKDNHKFQYKAIKSGGRSSTYASAVEWLEAAGVAVRCTNVSEAVAPLAAFAQDKSFKLYGADTGLLAARFEALPADIEPSSDKGAMFRGALAENFVFQQIRAAGANAYYWGTPSRYEVEFVARSKDGQVVPIEVKSGKNVSSKSLDAYRMEYKPAVCYRVSAKNFGCENGIRSIPLYAAWLLGEQLM